MDVTTLLGVMCAPGGVAPLGNGLLLGLFLAGLGGGVVHCAPMCGPFVLCQAAGRMARLPAARLCEARRIGGAMLVPYHLGRLGTYAGLGAIAGGLGAGLGQLPWFAPLSGVLLGAAALLFLTQAARRLSPDLLPGLTPNLARGPMRGPMGRLARLVRTHRGNGFVLGGLLGFLPCGLLYGALSVAVAGQDALGGAVALLAFGLGTVPALLAVGVLGLGAGRVFGRTLTRVAPAVMAVNALVLVVLAWQRLAA